MGSFTQVVKTRGDRYHIVLDNPASSITEPRPLRVEVGLD